MARTQETTPFYIRTDKGECFYVETFEEALEEFVGNDGYRLAIKGGNKELVIRRGDFWNVGKLGEKECTANLVYREEESNV